MPRTRRVTAADGAAAEKVLRRGLPAHVAPTPGEMIVALVEQAVGPLPDLVDGIPMRRCTGSKTFGIEAHLAPKSDFPVQPSRKDGLGTMCKLHWTQYTGALRKAALSKKGQSLPIKTYADRPATPAPKPARKPRPTKAPAPEVAEAQQLVEATEHLAGAEYTKAIGSDAVQHALEVLGANIPSSATVDTDD